MDNPTHGVPLRQRNIISGLIALVIVFGLITVGVNYAFGYFDAGYTVHGTFDAAGQGLIGGSDIKIRGLDVGHVEGVELVDGEAHVTMFIKDGIEIPADSIATVRPKTLFGEKFIDIERGDEGTLLADGDAFAEGNTQGGFELEQVLGDAYPVLQAVDPQELLTVLDSLAAGAEGMGEAVGRTIDNSSVLADQAAGRNEETRRFLEALSTISDELADRAGDVVTGARRLNEALPVLSENGDELASLLSELERLSSELNGVLTTNAAFVRSTFTVGQRVIDTLDANVQEIVPLVVGLRQFFQVLGEVGRIPLGNGTNGAAVQGLLGGELCLILPLPACSGGGGLLSTSTGAAAAPTAPSTTAPNAVADLLTPLTSELSNGTQALIDLLGGILGGAR